MARRKQYPKPKRLFYRINQFIRASEVRVVDEKGKQIGVMSLPKALKLAQEKKLDLVEVAPKAQPPVCKIIDFKKFKYLESKKRKIEKKKAKKVEIKQIRLTPFIAENDFKFRLQRAEEFLLDGDRVKVSVFFRGLEMTKKNFGYELLKKATEKLSALATVDSEPKFIGRRLEMQLSPIKGAKDAQNQTKDKKVSSKKV